MFSLSRPKAYITQGEISHLTGYNKHEVSRLLKAGLIKSNERDDVFAFCQSPAVSDIIDMVQPMPVIRLGEAGLDSDGLRKLGYDISYDTLELLEAARKYWTKNPITLEPYDSVLVSLGSLIIGAYSYDGYDPGEMVYSISDAGKQYTRWAYKMTQLKKLDVVVPNSETPVLSEDRWSPTQKAAAAMVGHRFRTGPGQPVGIFQA